LPDRINRWPQRVIFAAIGLAVAGAAAGRLAGPRPVEETGRVVAARELRFADRTDGAVVITDAQTGQTVDVLTGEQGFIRATMRGLARARHSEGIGAAAPFRLAAWTDGRLTLDDATTGRHLELQAFGSLNVASFARLLQAVPAADHASLTPGPRL
jgi:putative photosynthetic complex assembly protein